MNFKSCVNGVVCFVERHISFADSECGPVSNELLKLILAFPLSDAKFDDSSIVLVDGRSLVAVSMMVIPLFGLPYLCGIFVEYILTPTYLFPEMFAFVFASFTCEISLENASCLFFFSADFAGLSVMAFSMQHSCFFYFLAFFFPLLGEHITFFCLRFFANSSVQSLFPAFSFYSESLELSVFEFRNLFVVPKFVKRVRCNLRAIKRSGYEMMEQMQGTIRTNVLEHTCGDLDKLERCGIPDSSRIRQRWRRVRLVSKQASMSVSKRSRQETKKSASRWKRKSRQAGPEKPILSIYRERNGFAYAKENNSSTSSHKACLAISLKGNKSAL